MREWNLFIYLCLETKQKQKPIMWLHPECILTVFTHGTGTAKTRQVTNATSFQTVQSWSTKKEDKNVIPNNSQDRLRNEGGRIRGPRREPSDLRLIFHPSSPSLPQEEVSESLNTLRPNGTGLRIRSSILFQGISMIYGAYMSGPTHNILQWCYCSCGEIPLSVFLDDYKWTLCPGYNLLVWYVVNCKPTMTLRNRISNREVLVSLPNTHWY